MGKQTTSASLPRDDDSATIQILSPDVDNTVHLSATEGASARIILPTGTDIVRMASSGAVWLAFGGATVDAGAGQPDSMLMPAGTEFFFLGDDRYTYVAVRSVAGAGAQVVTATKMV